MATRLAYYKYILFVVLVLFYHVVIVPRIHILGVVADMSLIAALWFAFEHPPRHALIGGFVLGLLVGMLSPTQLGWSALLLAYIAFGLAYLKDRLAMESILLRLLVVLVVAFIYRLAFLVLTSFGVLATNSGSIFVDAALTAIYTFLVGAIVMPLLRYKPFLRRVI